MKERPVLYIAMAVSLFIEILLIILVYINVGDDKLPTQLGRLAIQGLLMSWIITQRSTTGLFLLMAYHILSGLFILYSDSATATLGIIIMLYHFIVGLLIYFHDWVEEKLGVTQTSKKSEIE